jgi:phospholipid transport system substrate-binding protein
LLNRTFMRTAALFISFMLPTGVGMSVATAQTGAQTQVPPGANAPSPTVEPRPLRETAKPEALIAEFYSTLLTVMRDARALKYAGRRDILRKQLFDVYHLPVMARIAVGSHWRKLTPAQQTQLVTHFSRLTLATYASRFSGWSGEKFEMRGVQPVRDKTVLVKTAIIRPNDEPVEINYLMRKFQAGWKVIDVFLKASYSELATKRSEYSSVLRRRGFDALISELDAKVAQYANTSN